MLDVGWKTHFCVATTFILTFILWWRHPSFLCVSFKKSNCGPSALPGKGKSGLGSFSSYNTIIMSITSVQALLAHINDVETEKRLTLVQVSEAEAETAHYTREAESHNEELARFNEMKAKRQRDIELLVSDGNQLHAQITAVDAAIERARFEEPVLLTAANASLEAAATHQAKWSHGMETLSEVETSWAGETMSVPLQRELDGINAEIKALQAEEKALLETAAASRTVNEKTADKRPECTDLSRLSQLIAAVEEAIAENEAQHTRELALAQLEIADAKSQVEDLTRWDLQQRNALEQLTLCLHDVQQGLKCEACRSATA